MPTLDWIGKQAVVNHHQEVAYHLRRDVPELPEPITTEASHAFDDFYRAER